MEDSTGKFPKDWLFTDESKRVVHENDYSSCWKEEPFNTGQVHVRRQYSGDIQGRQQQIEDMANKDGAAVVVPSDLTSTPDNLVVDYSIELSKLNIPHNLRVGDSLTISAIANYAREFEQLNVAEPLLHSDLANLCGPAANMLLDVARSVAKFAPELQSISLDEKNDHEIVDNAATSRKESRAQESISHTERLMKAFATSPDQPISEVIENTRNRLLSLLSQPQIKASLGESYKLWHEILTEADLGNSFRNEGLAPHAMLYHDIWYDSRFPNGSIPAQIYVGELPAVGTTHSDIDIGAREAMLSAGYGAMHLPVKTMEDFRQMNEMHKDGLYSPPDLTNLYVCTVPAISPEVYDMEQTNGLHAVEDPDPKQDGRLRLVFAETPGRLNPIEISRLLNERYGEGNWQLAKTTDQGLMKITTTPKDAWHIKSKQRQNIKL